MSNHLLRALSETLPHAGICLVSERPWHSLTFAGTQVSFRMTLSNKNHAANAAKFARQLSEQEFDIRGLLVADIAVSELIDEGSQTILVIDALLLGG